MRHHQKRQETLIAFLADNMREMETELRAHSIVLEALAQKVVGTHEIKQALTWARGSTAMLQFIDTKYAMIAELCATPVALPANKGAATWAEPREISKLPN